MPPLLLVPGRKTKQKRYGKQIFATDKLNIQFTLAQDYNAEELTLFYDFLGSETDTLFVDGEPVTKLVGVGKDKLKQTQITLPALSAGEHTLTITTSGGKGDGRHWIDYLKLEGIVAPQQPETSKEETMVNKKPTAKSQTAEKKKSYVMTSTTGMQD